MDILMEITERIGQWSGKRQLAMDALHKVGSKWKGAAEDKGKADELVEFSLRAKSLSELRVAAVMDRFTLDSYRPECTLMEVTPDGWKEELQQFQPDLLFIESAWQGKDGLWHRKIANGSKEYFALTSYCREQGIPIVFWNKEDPVYTDTFMSAAAMADVVFTTDIDCIEKYQRVLGHNRVYHLHFAAQPRLHDPVERYQRQDRFCFAGAYYHRYPQRVKIFDAFSQIFIQGKGLDIYDRNYGDARPEHAFPQRYAPYILGKLDPSEIDKAYKGYVYGVNMNSVDGSQSMFARRVFEMMASNTVTVGNYARGQKNYFGDLNICTNDQETLERMLERYCADEQTARKYRLLGLRKVLSQHLYEDRLDYVVQKVFGKSLKAPPQVVTVLGCAYDQDQLHRLLVQFRWQTYQNKRLIVFTDCQETPKEEGVRVFPLDRLTACVHDCVSEGYASWFRSGDWYGPNYLTDLMLTLRYGAWDVVGKACHYAGEQGSAVLRGEERYQEVAALPAWRSAAKVSLCGALRIKEYGDTGYSASNASLFAADEFHYCADWTEESCPAAEDLFVADQGLSMSELEQLAEGLDASGDGQSGKTMELEKGLLAGIKVPDSMPVTFAVQGADVKIESAMPEGAHSNFYISKLLAVEDCADGGTLQAIFRGSGDLDLMGILILLDRDKRRLKVISAHMNRLYEQSVPGGTVFVQVGLRVAGRGSYLLRRVAFGEGCTEMSGAFVSRSDVLVLTNQYPSFADLYRNAFVHKRVTAYREQGLLVDVMRMNIYAKDGYREFEGIDVVEGQARTLSAILDSGRIKTVCVHFLDEQMWSVLKYHLKEIRLLVWVHGAEIQPWWRREYNFTTEKELEEGKAASAARQAFWKEVFETAERESSIHFIFVSQYFADEVMEDNQIALRPEQYAVIHNCIDTDMFQYVPKDAEQRKKILSIKPYASRKYANDITMEAIVALSKKPCFKDMEFTLYGSGIRFEEDTAALKRFKNVHLHKQFLPQNKIAELHRAHGIFIATTRMDAQGVSRDEAMSSGLVPIASNVTAIPEFVDEGCGILVPGEDPQAVADAIERLYEDPQLFLRLSEGAAQRVRRQTSSEYTIDKEIALICGR